MGPGRILLSSEEAHHLEDVEEVNCEDDDMQNDVELCSEFDVLASEHGGKMHLGGRIGQGDWEWRLILPSPIHRIHRSGIAERVSGWQNAA